MLKTLLRRVVEAVAPARVPRQQPTPAPRPQVKTRPRHVPTHERGRRIEYSPNLDGDADPGEIVWTWVPYEDDPTQGKDRPVLVVGRSGRTVLGLMLTSKDRRDGEHNWLSIGTGAWDKDDRPSWIRLDRVIEVDHDGIRREGAILDRARFDEVAARLRQEYGWR
jgi:hypothetical protein